MSWKITIRGAKEAPAAIQAAIRAGVRDGLRTAGEMGVRLVQENIASPHLGRGPAYATGILHGSITHQLEDAPGLIARDVIFAQPPADQYAGYVEAGTLPHMPPVRALLLWVRLKFGVQDEKSALKIAWAVAMKIRQRGTFARGMFARALQRLLPMLQGIFERAIGAALERAGVGR